MADGFSSAFFLLYSYVEPTQTGATFYEPNSRHQEKTDILYPNSRQNIRKYFKKGEMWVKGDTHKGCSPS